MKTAADEELCKQQQNL